MVSLKDIESAKDRIGKYIYETPIIRMNGLYEVLGCEVYVKPECMQKTNSFKIRGALNKIFSLSKEQLDKGVVTVSSGNHGKGVAFAAKMLGIKAVVVLPNTAPSIKVEGIRTLGAEVVQCDIMERYVVANKLHDKYGYYFIHPYDDNEIIAGQGTCGYEIIHQLQDVNKVIVPIGGGGLISGVAIAIKGVNPKVKIIGVEPAIIPRYIKSREVGKAITLDGKLSLADALLTTKPGELNFPIVQQFVDEIVAVDEEYITKGTNVLMNYGKIIAEPSSCIGVGAVMQGKLKFEKNEKVCFLISGGNIELSTIAKL